VHHVFMTSHSKVDCVGCGTKSVGCKIVGRRHGGP